MPHIQKVQLKYARMHRLALLPYKTMLPSITKNSSVQNYISATATNVSKLINKITIKAKQKKYVMAKKDAKA